MKLIRPLVAVLCLLAVAPAVAQERPLTIFAAASLKEALDEASAAYAGAAGGGRPAISYAGSNQLARQIEQGAPADVFLSADEEWMDYLAARKLLKEGARRVLLGNRLVVAGPAGAAPVVVDRNLDLVGLLKGGRLAVPDMKAVPAGKYAKAALDSLGLFDQAKDRIAGAENVRVALAYVSRGEAPYGIVYATDAAADPKVAIVGFFPEDSHPKIVYPVAILATSTNPKAAAFVDFLRGPEAKAIFEKRGFSVP